MSQLIKDLESCVRTAKLAGPEWFKYTMMEITTDQAEAILNLVKAAERISKSETVRTAYGCYTVELADLDNALEAIKGSPK